MTFVFRLPLFAMSPIEILAVAVFAGVSFAVYLRRTRMR